MTTIDRRTTDRRVSPAVGEYAIRQTPALYAQIDRLRAELAEMTRQRDLERASNGQLEDGHQYLCDSWLKTEALNCELSLALQEIADFYANDCQCKLSDGFTCIVHRARAALAKVQQS